MVTTIQKWGNSLAVRLPKAVLRNIPLKEKSAVVIQEENGHITISPAPSYKKLLRKEAWKSFMIPMEKKKKENISGSIDKILYGVSR